MQIVATTLFTGQKNQTTVWDPASAVFYVNFPVSDAIDLNCQAKVDQANHAFQKVQFLPEHYFNHYDKGCLLKKLLKPPKQNFLPKIIYQGFACLW